MAIAFRSSSNAFFTGTTSENVSLTINKPAGVVDGDILVAIICANDTLTQPGGWTQVSSSGFYYKKASSEPSSYTWTIPTNQLMVGAIAAYSGCASASFVDQTSALVGGGPSTSAAATALTTTKNNEFVVWAWSQPGPNAVTQGFPGSITGRETPESDSDHIIAHVYMQAAIGDASFPTAGTTGSSYTTGSQSPSSGYNAYMLSLVPPQDNTVTVPEGSLSLTGLVPAFNQSVSMLPPLATMTLTGLLPALKNTVFSPVLGTMTLSGFVPVAMGTLSPTNPPVIPFLDPVPHNVEKTVSDAIWHWFKKVYKWAAGEARVTPNQVWTAANAGVVYTTTNNFYYPGDATSGNLQFILPLANTCIGKKYLFKKVDSTANTVAITVQGSDSIDGVSPSVSLTKQYDWIELVSNGNASWAIMSKTVGASGFVAPTVTSLASANLAQGAFVNIWNNAGTANVRNADASLAYEAHGYVNVAYTAGQTATVQLDGINAFCTGAVVGYVFLGNAGLAANFAPDTAAYIMQQLGNALSTTSIRFHPRVSVVITPPTQSTGYILREDGSKILQEDSGAVVQDP